MIARYRAALVTLAVLASVIGGARASPGPSTNERAFVPPPATTPATPDPRPFHTAAGFDLRLPPGWVAYERSDMVTRRSSRELIVANAPIPLPTEPYEQIGFNALDPGFVVVELLESGGPAGPDASTESSFPLDWSQARATPGGDPRTQLNLIFQHLLRSLTLAAHLGPNASAADRDALRGLVESLRPEPIPTSGVYRRWEVLGEIAALPVGSVTHFDTPRWSAGSFFLVRGAHTTYAFIDHAYLFMGAIKPCPLRYDAPARVFICDANGERWSRVGKQLDGSGFFGLGYHMVFVKDGLILVGGSAIGSSRNDEDEAAEFSDPIIPARSVAPLDRADVLARYGALTTTDPTRRVEAKLVPRSALDGFIRGVFVAPSAADPVWLVAFSGPVRIAGGGESPGNWAVFAVDPKRGGIVTAGCCQGGEWPAGFDALPDLAPPGS